MRITRAGFPTATESAGMSRVTTAPAPMTERSPMATPGQTITPPPNQQSSPTARFESSAALCRVERMQGGEQLHFGPYERVAADADRRQVEEHAVEIDERPFAD